MRQKHADVEEKDALNSTLLRQASFDLQRYFEKNAKNSILNKKKLQQKKYLMRQKQGMALEITEKFGAYLGQALVNLAATVDPAVFVIGGGVSKAGDILLDIMKVFL